MEVGEEEVDGEFAVEEEVVEAEDHVTRVLCHGHVRVEEVGSTVVVIAAVVHYLTRAIKVCPPMGLTMGPFLGLDHVGDRRVSRDRVVPQVHERRSHGLLGTVPCPESEISELGPWNICDEQHGIRFRR